MLAIVPAAPPITCDAYRLLCEADAALDYSRYIEAGCYLREGIKSMLTALCTYHGVPLSRRKSRNTSGTLVNGLLLHGHLDRDQADDVLVAVEVGNRAAHCCFVLPSDIEDATRSMRWFYRYTPFGREGSDA